MSEWLGEFPDRASPSPSRSRTALMVGSRKERRTQGRDSMISYHMANYYMRAEGLSITVIRLAY